MKAEVRRIRDECEVKEESAQQMEIEVSKEATRRRELNDNIAIIDKQNELKELKNQVLEQKQLMTEKSSGLVMKKMIKWIDERMNKSS